MSQLNDEILRVTGGPTVNEGLAAWYGKTPTESLNDAEYRWLGEQLGGTTLGTINDRWLFWLGLPHINDAKLDYWSKQPDFGNPRWKLNFTGTNYAEMATPLTSSGDFEIRIVFNTTDTVVWKMLLGVLGSSVNFLGIAGTTGLVRFDIESQRLNSVVRVDDGLNHVVKVKREGNLYTLLVDGVVQETMTYAAVGEFTVSAIGTYDGVTFSYLGIIDTFRLTDVGDTTNSISWDIDCNCIIRQPSNEYPTDPTKDLILRNVNIGDWVGT